MSDIEDLTYSKANSLLKAVTKRNEQNEYLERLHIGLESIAIVKALGAAIDNKEIKMDDLVGKAPGEYQDNNEIEQWKQQAKNKGLKIGN